MYHNRKGYALVSTIYLDLIDGHAASNWRVVVHHHPINQYCAAAECSSRAYGRALDTLNETTAEIYETYNRNAIGVTREARYIWNEPASRSDLHGESDLAMVRGKG
jgi:hypothetical protein